MVFEPTSNYRKVFKIGMSGWDVEAAQIAFNGTPSKPDLVLDGVFGKETDAAARIIQKNLGIKVDGIIGPETQEKLCKRECARAEIGWTPANLIVGVCLGESSGQFACTSTEYSSKTRDYGELQDNKPVSSTEATKRAAYNIATEAHRVAQEVRSSYEAFKAIGKLTSAEALWKAAVLNYNWPVAAEQIAKGVNMANWRYKSDGVWYGFDDPAPWIVNIGLPNVQTGRQWCDFYVQSKVAFVTSWNIRQ